MQDFAEKVAEVQDGPLRASGIDVLQVNMGFRCNMSCRHCHVSGGPKRQEAMQAETVDAVLEALSQADVPTLDITGGSPELNPNFRRLVKESRALGRHVIVRSNLTIFFEDGMDSTPEFYAENNAEVVASLPYYIGSNVDRVRGDGTFEKSIDAMRRLNDLGYGNGEGPRRLNLVYNPQGAFLPPAQEGLAAEYRRELGERFGIGFNDLYTFANMPIGRFRSFLERNGSLENYIDSLACAFNPDTLDGIMCRKLLSVGWDGSLYDCDFNMVLGLGVNDSEHSTIRDFDAEALESRKIRVAEHCFGCTAGQGST